MGRERATKLRRMKVLVRGSGGTIGARAVRARDRDEVVCASCVRSRESTWPGRESLERGFNVVAGGQITTTG